MRVARVGPNSAMLNTCDISATSDSPVPIPISALSSGSSMASREPNARKITTPAAMMPMISDTPVAGRPVASWIAAPPSSTCRVGVATD